MALNKPSWPKTAADEGPFKAFIFAELNRRIGAQTAAMADEAQGPENLEMFLDAIATGLSSPEPRKRGRGRPPVEVERQFVPSEAGARIADMIRQIFQDEYRRRNLTRPSPADMAAEYVGVKVKSVKTRQKRMKVRRPD